MKRLFSVFVIFFGVAHAATYYVNQAGSGSADGSSLGNAASVATLNSHTSAPDDVISLNSTITSTIIVHNSGTSGHPITYQYASGAKSSAPFWGLTTTAGIYATAKNYVTIDGNNTGIIECTANGDALANQQKSSGIYATGCDNFIVQNITIQNIFIHTAGVNNPAGVGPYDTVGFFCEEGSNIDMHGSSVTNAYCMVLWKNATAGTKSGHTVHNNTASACSTPVVIANSTSGSTTNNVTVYSNDLTMGANWFDTPDANHIDGIHFWGLAGGKMTNVSAYSNYIHGDCSTHSTAFIFWEGDMGTVNAYNNYLVASTNHPLEGYINQAYNASANTGQICNNTIIGLGTTSSGGNGITVDPSNASTITTIRGNIIKSCNVGIYYPANTGTLTSDYNDFFNLGSVANNGGFKTTLANWQATTLPQGGTPDAHGINTDPALDGSGNITNTSPCYNTSTDTSAYGVTTDRFGTSRPQSTAYDIGMMEVVVGGTTPTLSSATINTAGTNLTLNLSESCTTGAGGSGGVTVSPSGGASTATYSSGSGSTAYVYSLSRTIKAGETVTVSYVQPGNGIEATSSGNDLATFSGTSVTNNSTVTSGGAVRGGKRTSGGSAVLK